MLCTPPAFILSQDQTLYELLLNAPYEALILFCSAYFKFKRNQRVPYISCDTYVYNSYFVLNCCSVFNVRSSLPPLGDSLSSLPQVFPFVKSFFKLFSNFFFIVSTPRFPPAREVYFSTEKPFCQALFFNTFQQFVEGVFVQVV